MICRYPVRALWADYARAGTGLALSGAPPLLLDLSQPLVLGCIGLVGLFAVYAVHAVGRRRLRLAVSDAALEIHPAGRSLGWGELTKLRLAYYTTRRDRRGGWMELKLRWGRHALRVDSRIEGFESLLRVAVVAAHSRGVTLDSGSLANLTALGIEPDGRDDVAVCGEKKSRH